MYVVLFLASIILITHITIYYELCSYMMMPCFSILPYSSSSFCFFHIAQKVDERSSSCLFNVRSPSKGKTISIVASNCCCIRISFFGLTVPFPSSIGRHIRRINAIEMKKEEKKWNNKMMYALSSALLTWYILTFVCPMPVVHSFASLFRHSPNLPSSMWWWWWWTLKMDHSYKPTNAGVGGCYQMSQT